jgi:hypothetical protein
MCDVRLLKGKPHRNPLSKKPPAVTGGFLFVLGRVGVYVCLVINSSFIYTHAPTQTPQPVDNYMNEME